MTTDDWTRTAVLNLFAEGYRQNEVAKKLDLHPTTVSNIISEAKRLGHLRIIVCPPVGKEIGGDLERLKRELRPLGIRDVLATDGEGVSPVAALGARFFEQHGQDGHRVVLDGGRTVRETVRSLKLRAFDDVTVAPLCADPPSDESSAFEVMTLLCEKLRPNVLKKSLPYYSSPLLAEKIDDVRATARAANFVFLGVAPFGSEHLAPDGTPSNFIAHLGLDPRELARGFPDVVAFCGHYSLSADGQFVPLGEFHRRLPWSLTFADLQERAAADDCNVVVLAADERKLGAVNAVIKAGICNTLIIDRGLAEALVRSRTR